MDLIVNDLSLYGQYSSISVFLENLCKNIIPCLEIARRKKISLFKSYKTYSRKVLSGKTLHDLLIINGNVLLVKFKSQIAALLSEPYWDATSKNGDCLLEATTRAASLLSFVPSNYEQKNIFLEVEDRKVMIINSFDKSSFLEALSNFGVINLSNRFIIPGYARFEYEIRTREPSNHVPHFHILVDKEDSASVSLKDFKIIKSELSPRKWGEVFSEAIALIEQDKEDYLDVWFYYHPKAPDSRADDSIK